MDSYKVWKKRWNTKYENVEGTLNGYTFAVKDVIAFKDHISSAGNPDWEKRGIVAENTSQIIEKLLLNGAELKGFTHTDELMFGLNGENEHYGTPVNPLHHLHIPGGSSSGSAVAVSADLVDFAIGTDTAGSVRVPASYCGIYGFRPTHGVIPLDGVIPLADRFDTVGWFSKNPHLLYEVGEVLLPKTPQIHEKSFKTVLIASELEEVYDAKFQPIYQQWISELTGKGYEVRKINLPFSLKSALSTFRMIQGYQIWNNHGKWIETYQPKFGKEVEARFKWSSTITLSEKEKAEDELALLKQQIEELLHEDQLLMMATTPSVAPRLKGSEEDIRVKSIMLTSLSGIAQLPQVSIPNSYPDGLAQGVSFLAKNGQDQSLLSFAKKLSPVINNS
ncbi:amidase [Alkalihalobacillus trypoxylicola]|uniref:Amidase domain-containing protein n=1 Tax=Alkalihalobacillus trypoxylicola TaxID=519424 RepID=A0A162DQH5_9BACI|nr:amidase [Alkalihalobacillus trypoxylicola]KYG30562.1 hypothetical protein AZF04_19505 [Alkalihalobacillus trypoxylicola]